MLARENQAKAVRAAAELLDLTVEDRRTLKRYLADGEETREAADARAVADLALRNRLSLDLLGEAVRRTGCDWEIGYDRGASLDLPPLLGIVELSKLNAAAGWNALDGGDLVAAVAAVRRGLALERSLLGEPVLIVQLVAGSVNRIHAGLLRDLVGRTDLDETTLAALQAELSRIDPHTAAHRGLLGERSWASSVFRPAPTSSAGWAEHSAFLRWLARPLSIEIQRFYLERMDRALAWQQLPRHRREAELGRDGLQVRPRPWQRLAADPIPDLDRVLDRTDLWEACVVLERTALALERYRARHRVYPRSLDELVPELLDAAALDPFSGQPPAYSNSGHGYVLSSEGQNLKLDPRTETFLYWEVSR